MAETISTFAVGAAASGMPAAIGGFPPQEVILWSMIGGLGSVWLSRKSGQVVTTKWLCGALAQIGLSAATGVALSALLLAIAPGYSWLAPLSGAPRWAVACVIAALAFKVGPVLWASGQKWLGSKQGDSNAE